MPAPAEVVFDAFHYHRWRAHWDSLVSRTQVQGGAPCPCVGAVSENTGGGWLRSLSMTTRFVSYDPPVLAAASMVGQSFPFSRWAASMRHQPLPDGRSVLVYTYTFSVAPRGAGLAAGARGRPHLPAGHTQALRAPAEVSRHPRRRGGTLARKPQA